MDYSSGNDCIPFVGYLEIDPTITTTGSGTFDVTPLHTHIISSGTIDGVALSGTQVTALQVDIDATNQYHTLAGTTLIVSYTVSTVPAPPTSLTTTTGIPIVTSWTAPIDDGDDTITAYQVFRTTNAFTQVELPNSSGSDSKSNNIGWIPPSACIIFHLPSKTINRRQSRGFKPNFTANGVAE